MGDLLNLTDEDRRELRRNAPFIERTSHLIRGLPLVGVFAAIARSGISSGDIDDLMDLLNMISHEYWKDQTLQFLEEQRAAGNMIEYDPSTLDGIEGEGIAAVLRELGGDC